MASQGIQLEEPAQFAAGDTLNFEKYLGDMLPGDGWSLTYTLTDLNGQKVESVQSTTSATNGNRHRIYQQGFAASLVADDYILAGVAINASSADRKQIYKAVLTIGTDLTDGLAAGSQQTESETILSGLYETYKQLLKLKFSETEDLRSRFRLQDQTKVLEDIKYWKEVVIWERRSAKSANGQPDGSTTSPVMRVFY